MTNLADVELSSSVTVGTYYKMEQARDRQGLADFIDQRLRERYIRPLQSNAKHGFAMMAACCLLIETLESFHRGWKTTQKKGRGKRAFYEFFRREDRFTDLRGHSDVFYVHVRCGILHQGETTGGWKITREIGVPLFEVATLTIHATKFQNRLSSSLLDYASALKTADWNSIMWRNFRQKMDAVITNCKTKP